MNKTQSWVPAKEYKVIKLPMAGPTSDQSVSDYVKQINLQRRKQHGV
tara:strand:+ start:926 stop:1066 length:141 start_codon:yes stop_codon:yes gene_type:complete